MKNFAAGSRLGLAFVLSAAVTAIASLTVQNVSAETATETVARAGSTITRYPVKLRQIRNIPSLTDAQSQSK